MVEKFSDYEGTQYIDKEGTFDFEIMSYELKDSKNGTPMAVFECKSSAGTTTIYHSLNPKARWSYNKLIKICMNLDTEEKINAFELDYETIGNQLVGKHFLGEVGCEMYDKEIKVPNDDGTFTTTTERRESYKIKDYLWS
jgi:hypothetical protein